MAARPRASTSSGGICRAAANESPAKRLRAVLAEDAAVAAVVRAVQAPPDLPEALRDSRRLKHRTAPIGLCCRLAAASTRSLGRSFLIQASDHHEAVKK